MEATPQVTFKVKAPLQEVVLLAAMNPSVTTLDLCNKFKELSSLSRCGQAGSTNRVLISHSKYTDDAFLFPNQGTSLFAVTQVQGTNDQVTNPMSYVENGSTVLGRFTYQASEEFGYEADYGIWQVVYNHCGA